MPNDSHQHVVKTTSQWNERAVEYWVVPRGCLCVELTPDGKTKLKIGEGNKYYHQLPYVTDGSDLSQYYTKEEIDNLLNNFNRMAIMDTEEKESKDYLPLDGNKLGDVYLVKSQDPSTKPDPDVYLWTGSKWIYVGYDFTNIDLSHYLTKEEFHQLFDNVQEKVDIMWPKMHSHQNINVLDRIEEPYTTAEKEKLAGLRNYDSDIDHINYDIDLLMVDKHHHDNKSFLDTITEDYQIWSIADREKFDNIPDYTGVIAEIQYEIQVLNEKSHTHGIDGKGTLDILNRIEEPYTTSEKEKLAGLENYSDFIGTNGMYSGTHGLVPAPSTRDVGKVLSSTGTWVSLPEITVDDFIGATDSTDGAHGLVPAPLAGEETYFLKGDGTWSEVPEYELPPATTTTLGGIIVGDNLTIDEDGVLSAQAGGESYSEGDGIEFKNVNPYGIPSEYTVVEYIGNTSNSYILTDYVPNTNTKIVMDINAHQGTAAWQTIFGARDAVYPGGNEYAFFSRCDSDYKFYPRITGNTYTYMVGTYDERITVTIDGTLITVEKEDHTSYSYTQSGSLANLSNAMTIFALHNGNSIGDAGIIDLYSFKIYENNALVKQYIPCYRNSDVVIGLYETVNGVFYTNGGTGTFSKGNDVDTEKTINAKLGIGLYFDTNDAIAADVYDAGDGLFLGVEYTHNQNTDIPETYLQVEYLESTGTQYINTGQRYDTGYYHYEVDCEIDNENNNQMFGMRYWYDHAIDIYGGVYQACDSSSYIINSTIPAGDRVYCTLDRPTKTTTIESDSTTFTHTFSSDYSPSSSVYPVVLFAYWTSWSDSLSGYGKGKIYSFKYYSSSDTLTREMYPCIRKSDNVPGMYDTVNNVFYTNNGTGDFSYGDPLTVTDYIPGNTFNVKLGSGLYFDSSGRIAASGGGGGGTTYQAGDGIEIIGGASNDTISAKLGDGLQFNANGGIEVEPQYVRVSTTDSFVLLHTKPGDWDTNWDKYYELTYDQLPGVPPDWDPTKHYKYINDNYVLGSPGDTFVSTTWYDKHYVGLDPNTPVVFDSDVYYTGDLSLITDGENFDTAFEKVNEAIQHIERLENEVGFLKGSSVGIRTTSDPERIEFYRN